jgi:hypothetical protein
MSADALIHDYFTRDLSEAEDEALAQALEASPELAERFAAAAEQDLARLGAGKAPRKAGLLWAGAAALALGSVWWASSREQAPMAQVAVVDERPYEEAGVDRGPARLAAKEEEEEAEVPAAPRPQAAAPTLIVRAAAGSARRFDARLEGAAPGAALLVLDAGGQVLRRLAPSRAGHWSWDGRDAQGRELPQGIYRFETALGGKVLGQWVQIEEKR